MTQIKTSCDDGFCRDGAFVLIFRGNMSSWNRMEFLLGLREDDYSELLGGGYDLHDLTPACAASRELLEEANFVVDKKELTFFANMVQKLPMLGENEKGYVFYFYKKLHQNNSKNLTFLPSHEHKAIQWHTVEEIFKYGESRYKTSTLRAIVHLLNYLTDKKVRLGVLKDKVSFQGYEF